MRLIALFVCSAAVISFGAEACSRDADCDDDNACTRNVCFEGRCAFLPYGPDHCKSTQPCITGTCNSRVGCVFAPTDCTSNSPCVESWCDAELDRCVSSPKNCDTGDPCSVDYCSVADGGCVHRPKCKHNGPQGNACFYTECVNGRCIPREVNCGRSDACVRRWCDSVTGGCVETHPDCNDGDFCTEDFCSPSVPGGCVHVRVSDASCSDGDACTDDRCASPWGCVHEPIYCEKPVNACRTSSCSEGRCGERDAPVPVLSDPLCTMIECDPRYGWRVAPRPCADVVALSPPPPFLPSLPLLPRYPIESVFLLPTPPRIEPCDDSDMCTLDIELPEEDGGGCFHIPVSLPEVDETACTVTLCDPATGDLYSAPRDCSDETGCTTDSCAEGLGCQHALPVVPSYLSEECVTFSCVNATLGRYEWIASPTNVSCWTEDVCHRFSCDGSGRCALRRGEPSRCMLNVFASGTTTVLFVVLVIVTTALMLLVALAVGATATADYRTKTAEGRRKKRDDDDER